MSNDQPAAEKPPLNAGEFLRQLLQELNTQVGGIWVAGEGQLKPAFSIGLEESGLFEGAEGKSFLQQILSDTLNQARPQIYDTEGLITPKAFGHATLFVVPMLIPNARPGIVLVADRPQLPQQQRLGVIRHIESRCRELAQQLAKMIPPRPTVVPLGGALPSADVSPATAPTIQIGSPSPTQGVTQQVPAESRQAADPQAVLNYLLSLQRSLDLNEVANVIVNDGRILFGADRVSLAMRRGRKAVISAVSGQESVHPRGNLIRALRRLTQKVIQAGEPFRYDGSLANVPKQLEEPLADFIQEGGARFLLIAPLLQPERLVKPEDLPGGGKRKQIDRKTIGALIVEQMSSSEPSAKLKGTLDSVIDHVSAAAFNARSHSSIFLLPLWSSIGRFFEWLRGRRLVAALAIVALLVAAGVSLAVVPWDYRVDASGQLMPVIQREVFAPWDGQIIELYVQDREIVEVEQPLFRLRNDELAAELVKVENEVQQKQKLRHSLQAQIDDAEKNSKPDEANKARGKELETNVEIKGALLQLGILKDRTEHLTVRAPIAGRVTTFQVEQLLLNRPVKRGDALLQVMDESGDWQLELEIAETRVGRILRAQKALSQNLEIEYQLLTSLESRYQAKLKSLGSRTVTAEEKGSVLEARATLNSDDLPSRVIGAEVRARIGCGLSNLGDVLFGDVVEFVQKYCWW